MASSRVDMQPDDVGNFMTFLADNDDGDEMMDDETVSVGEKAVWCEKCGIHNIGECFIHGGRMTVTPDNAMPTRACLSLPKILALKRVRNSEPCVLEAKRGVFSKKMIKARTLFGPMEAKRVHPKPRLQTGIMEYQIQLSIGRTEYLDTSDENSCNWMMFVRPADVFAHKNMEAFQENEQIYFVTCKNIPKGAELRVWYAAAYAKAIGKRILLPEQVDKKPLLAPSRRGRKSLQETLHKNTTSSVISCEDTVTDTSKTCNINDSEPEDMIKKSSIKKSSATVSAAVPEKSSRSSRATKDYRVFFSCNTCSTTFTKLGQLDSHVCKELGEGEDDNIVCGTRRRKGRPRKRLESEENSPSVKLVKVTSGRQDIEPEFNDANIPCEDIINHVKEEDDPPRSSEKLYEEKDLGTISFPSTEIIPMTTEFFSDEGENQSFLKSKRGPGRPAGAKNKGTLVAKQEIDTKNDVSLSKRQTYTCVHCDKTFTSHEQHLVHEASHTNTLPYVCEYAGCGKSFSSKFKHQRHLTVHKKPNNFKCKFCSSTFNRVDHLKNHLLVHDSNRNTYTCDICGKSYLYRTNLTFHMAKHGADEGESLECLVCSKKFESKEELKMHINIHNRYKKEAERQRKHSCPQCHKLFTTAKDIRRHMVTHSKERHFLCEHCPQTFVRKDHLRRHYTSNHKKEFYEIQMKDNPYGCSTCLVVFKKKDFLDYHMKSAHPEGMTDTEGKKTGKGSSKPSADSSNDASSPTRVSRESQSQLVRHLLLQKNPKEMFENHSQPLVHFPAKSQQLVPASQSNNVNPYPVSIVKIQPVTGAGIGSGQFAVVCSSSTQAASSQANVYDSEDMMAETYGEQAKTVPFRFDNQLVCQPQLLPGTQLQQVQPGSQLQQGQITTQLQQGQIASQLQQGQITSQLQQGQITTQLQQEQITSHLQQGQSSLAQGQTVQQLKSDIHISEHQEQQFTPIQLHQQQFQQQQQKMNQQLPHPQSSASSATQTMQLDLLNNLASLSQTQDMPGPLNTSILNIIHFGGQNFILGTTSQVLDLNRPVQLAVIKDPQVDNRQPVPQLSQPHHQILGKAEACGAIHPQDQIIPVKPDHCYASATMSNPTLSQILHGQSRTMMDKPVLIQGQQILDEDAKQIIAQIKHPGSSLESTQGQGEMLVMPQQHLHQMQDRFQENQQLDQTQQQLQNLPSFALSWTDSLQDYASVSELPVSADVTAMGQADGLGSVVPGSTPASWILQLPASVLEQPQVQAQHLQNSHIMTVNTSGASTHV